MVLTPKTIDCDSARALMFDYIDGVLGEREAVQLQFHIKSCEACRAELEERRAMLESVGKTAYSVPPTLHQSIMDKISDMPQEKDTKPIFRFKTWMGTITAACAAIMILVVAVGYLGRAGMPDADDVKNESPAKIMDAAPTADENADAAEISPLDIILADVSENNNAVIVCRKSDFTGAPIGERSGEILVNGVCYERYVITENAMAEFTGCAERLTAEAIDYRAAVISGEQVDTFEIYLLADGED